MTVRDSTAVPVEWRTLDADGRARVLADVVHVLPNTVGTAVPGPWFDWFSTVFASPADLPPLSLHPDAACRFVDAYLALATQAYASGLVSDSVPTALYAATHFLRALPRLALPPAAGDDAWETTAVRYASGVVSLATTRPADFKALGVAVRVVITLGLAWPTPTFDQALPAASLLTLIRHISQRRTRELLATAVDAGAVAHFIKVISSLVTAASRLVGRFRDRWVGLPALPALVDLLAHFTALADISAWRTWGLGALLATAVNAGLQTPVAELVRTGFAPGAGTHAVWRAVMSIVPPHYPRTEDDTREGPWAYFLLRQAVLTTVPPPPDEPFPLIDHLLTLDRVTNYQSSDDAYVTLLAELDGAGVGPLENILAVVLASSGPAGCAAADLLVLAAARQPVDQVLATVDGLLDVVDALGPAAPALTDRLGTVIRSHLLVLTPSAAAEYTDRVYATRLPARSTAALLRTSPVVHDLLPFASPRLHQSAEGTVSWLLSTIQRLLRTHQAFPSAVEQWAALRVPAAHLVRLLSALDPSTHNDPAQRRAVLAVVAETLSTLDRSRGNPSKPLPLNPSIAEVLEIIFTLGTSTLPAPIDAVLPVMASVEKLLTPLPPLTSPFPFVAVLALAGACSGVSAPDPPSKDALGRHLAAVFHAGAETHTWVVVQECLTQLVHFATSAVQVDLLELIIPDSLQEDLMRYIDAGPPPSGNEPTAETFYQRALHYSIHGTETVRASRSSRCNLIETAEARASCAAPANPNSHDELRDRVRHYLVGTRHDPSAHAANLAVVQTYLSQLHGDGARFEPQVRQILTQINGTMDALLHTQ
ncbi:hypothetical protein IWQ60_004839 [Tieghemiomyces parasiticus]|uniref:Uncharacterized protein n=1 Tax=Tieghemiomyces parasiticus TaxID=78921 RepID=A0A9W8DV61_9FUNG|nr:hypothetical protein IWQ60_004839 [Tieghemiomyces parasiticus]